MQKTSKQATIDALNGRYLDDSTGKINESYLNDALTLVIANTERLYDACHSKPRRKPTAIAWEALMYLANDAIEWEAHPGKPTVAASDHLKYWLTTFGRGYDTIAEAVEWVAAEQRGEHQ